MWVFGVRDWVIISWVVPFLVLSGVSFGLVKKKRVISTLEGILSNQGWLVSNSALSPPKRYDSESFFFSWINGIGNFNFCAEILLSSSTHPIERERQLINQWLSMPKENPKLT